MTNPIPATRSAALDHGGNPTRTYGCDVCPNPIEAGTKMVEIGEYGLRFHVACFLATSGPRMVELMGYDSTLVVDLDEAGAIVSRQQRVRCPTAIQSNGSVEVGRGGPEYVDWR